MSKKEIVTILVAFLFTFVVSCSFGLSNSLGIYIVYFSPLSIPIFIIYSILESYFTGKDKQDIRATICGCTFIICLPIFFGIYFGIYHPLFSVEYERIENCQVIGIAPMAQPNYDVYTILYVNFEYDGQNFLGYACMSDHPNSINYDNYQYFYKDDSTIPCDDVGESYDTIENKRVLNDNNLEQSHQTSRSRLLRVRGNCKQRGKTLTSLYNFSQIKLPQWMCIERGSISFEDLTKPKTCYINFHLDRERSYKNSKNRLNLREVNFFAISVFEYPYHFAKAGFFSLIGLTYLPLQLNFYFLSKAIIKPFYRHIIKLYKKIQ